MMKTDRKITVAFAEDDFLVAEMIQGTLIGSGYELIGQAEDGLQIVELVKSLRPDIVLMDINLPGIDGIEATAQIQAECPTPVIVLTAYDEPSLIQKATKAGANAFLVKPLNGRELDRAISISMARFDEMRELRRLNEELISANQDLEAFSYTVAHDLKTPINLIIGFADLLTDARARLSGDKQKEYLDTMAVSARKMLKIVESLLLMAQVRGMEVPKEPVEMEYVILEVKNRLMLQISERQAVIDSPERWPLVLSHAPWLEEVWANYMSNALTYGGAPCRISLGFDDLGSGMLRLWIRDNGPGIDPAEQAGIFIPFQKGSRIKARGHGLGLSIVQRIVDKLGGEVGVDSELGKGSTFWFTLPLA